MDKTVNAFLQPDKSPEIGERPDLALDNATDRIILGYYIPGIGFDLLHAKGYAPVFRIDTQDLGLHRIPNLNDFGRVLDLAVPGHFADVDEPFDAVLKLDEGTVIGDAHNLAVYPRTDGIPGWYPLPGIFGQLFHAEGDTLLFFVELKDLDLDIVTDGQHFRWMLQSAP